MNFLVIFENPDTAYELEATLHKNGHGVKVCFNFADAMQVIENKEIDVVLASDMAVTDEEDRHTAILSYLQRMKKANQALAINLLCKKNPPQYFSEECARLNVNVEISKAEIELEVKEQPVEVDSEPLGHTKKLTLLLAMDEKDIQLERQIRGLTGVEVIGVARNRKELQSGVNGLNPHAVVAVLDLPSESEGNWIEICKQIDQSIEIFLVSVDREDFFLNSVIEGRLIKMGVEFIEPNPTIGRLREVILKPSKEPLQTEAVSSPKIFKGLVKTPLEKPEKRGKRFETEKITQLVGSATQTAISAVAGATKAVKGMNINIKLPSFQGAPSARLANVIAVCSPASSGKSFIAQNTAAVLARFGHQVSLVDLSEQQAQYTYFKIPLEDWEEDYKATVEKSGGFEKYGYETLLGGRLKGSLRIFACDPLLGVKFNAGSVGKLLRYAAGASEYVIVDMPKNISLGFTEAAAGMANTLFIVCDTDMSHLGSLALKKNEYDNIHCTNKLMVLNKYFELGSPDKDILAISLNQKRKELPEADGLLTVPMKTELAAISQCVGKPAVILNAELTNAFLPIYQYIKKVI